jgi:hypothetical protein
MSSKAGRPECCRYSFISFGSWGDDVTCVLGTVPGTENEQQDTIKHTLHAIIITYAFKNTADTHVRTHGQIIARNFDFH